MTVLPIGRPVPTFPEALKRAGSADNGRAQVPSPLTPRARDRRVYRPAPVASPGRAVCCLDITA
ncbi:protein of unknown function [Candidatus Filomicrobium marinum]|uniref:Uncharacterized protein n=1 Tax=Candidatus Filomicrobium marinum TaxID=1608628 RepID=A0A0D6JEM7_9HYPH|nr:protein of unknown function [Candidatus Filomicrobium marinum]